MIYTNPDLQSNPIWQRELRRSAAATATFQNYLRQFGRLFRLRWPTGKRGYLYRTILTYTKVCGTRSTIRLNCNWKMVQQTDWSIKVIVLPIRQEKIVLSNHIELKWSFRGGLAVRLNLRPRLKWSGQRRTGQLNPGKFKAGRSKFRFGWEAFVFSEGCCGVDRVWSYIC